MIAMTSTTSEVLAPTAARIITTARQLFMQRGYRAVSITDIVQAAEITKPTLYYHFADKEELFVQVALHMLDQMHAGMQAVITPQSDISGKLIALVEMMFSTPDLNSRMVRQEAREHLSQAQQQRIGAAFGQYMFYPIRQVMAWGIEHGQLSATRSADELAMLFLCLIEGFQYQVDTNTTSAARSEATPFMGISFSPAAIVQMFLHGVAA